MATKKITEFELAAKAMNEAGYKSITADMIEKSKNQDGALVYMPSSAWWVTQWQFILLSIGEIQLSSSASKSHNPTICERKQMVGFLKNTKKR